MTDLFEPQCTLAGLIWRPVGTACEILLVQRQDTAPTGAGFWDFFELTPHEAGLCDGLPAGRYPAPAWSPNGRVTQVVLLAPHRIPKDAAGWARYPLPTWMTPEAWLAAHHSGLWPLSLAVLATLRALVASGEIFPLAARLQAAAAALQQAATAVYLREALVPGIMAMPLLSPTLPPATHTNCYILGDSDLTIVDPGTPYPAEIAAFMAVLRQKTSQGARIRQVWITHAHADHVGAAMHLKKQFGATIMAHADTAAALREQVTIDRLLDDEAVVHADGAAYTALHTPGHAHGHLSFWAHQGGHLLSGDNILGTGTPIVPPAPHGNMQAYMTSLRRVLARPLGMLFPGHGPPCASSARRAQETLHARLQREKLLLKALGTPPGFITLDALVAQVYRGLGHSLRGLAELATLAHLEKLVADGAVQHRPAAQDLPQAWRLPLASPLH